MKKYLVTLQYANGVQFTPSVPRPNGAGYQPEPFEAETSVVAARLCYEKYREKNESEDNIMISGVALDFAIVLAEAEDDDQPSIASIIERVATIPAAEIISE